MTLLKFYMFHRKFFYYYFQADMEILIMTNYSSETTMAVVTPEYNVTTMSPEVKKKLLGIINLKQTIKYSPVLAVYTLMMIIGLIGNSFVLYIYNLNSNAQVHGHTSCV